MRHSVSLHFGQGLPPCPYSKRRKAIKECLLEQTIIAGIGNIYSDEILFTEHVYTFLPDTVPGQAEDRLSSADAEQSVPYFLNG